MSNKILNILFVQGIKFLKKLFLKGKKLWVQSYCSIHSEGYFRMYSSVKTSLF